jgi:RIO kinase 1
LSYDEDRVYRRMFRREALTEIKNRMLEKDASLESSAFEEVFDKMTLMILYELMRRGVFSDFHGVISAGKESRIYHAKNAEGEELAVKIYLVNNTEFRKNRMIYVAGDHNFQRVGSSLRKFIYSWARRELRNLELAYNAGVPVPRPLTVEGNVLVMSFLGVDGVRYPLLRETSYTADEYAGLYGLVVEYIRRLYKDSGLIHGDLSEYNIMAPDPRTVYFIDLSQSVLRDTPYAEILLMRDLRNVSRFFASRGVDVLNERELFVELTGKDPPSELTPI